MNVVELNHVVKKKKKLYNEKLSLECDTIVSAIVNSRVIMKGRGDPNQIEKKKIQPLFL